MRVAELRARIRCKYVGDTNEDEKVHRDKDAQEVCRVIVAGFREGRSQELGVQQICSGFDRLDPLLDFGAAHPLSQFLRCKCTQ